jgi:acetyl-CoA carboxylase biotin carboxyl carrier protein
MPNIAAHITGTVVRVEKQPGDPVVPGETVVVLESMKMEMPLEAEVGGTVKEVRCKAGQPVAEGDVLLVLE